MLYYCGFDAFLQFKKKPDPGVYLHRLSDLVLDESDQIINAFIGWCCLFLQTGKGQILFLGYSKHKRQNSMTVCSNVPKYVVNIECGAKETFLLTLDSQLYKWSGFDFEKTPPELVQFVKSSADENDTADQDHHQGDETGGQSNGLTTADNIKVEQLSVGAEYSSVLTEERQAYHFDPAELRLVKQVATEPIAAVAAGQEHILLLTETGQVLSYGNGSRGQLGHGSLDNVQNSAQTVEALAGIRCKAIAAGGWHSMVLSEIGDVYVWGWNESGQLGFSRDQIKMITEPRLLEVSEDDNFASIGAGSRHSMAVSENGILFGWGWNKYGQLGMSLDTIYFDSPAVIPFDYKVTNVICKFWSSLIETDDQEDGQTPSPPESSS